MQQMINYNDQQENAKQIPCVYQVNDKMLLIIAKCTKHVEREMIVLSLS